jgi:4'-phosphopantetheinyl transferase
VTDDWIEAGRAGSPPLVPGRVHLWRVDLDTLTDRTLEAFEGAASDEERRRRSRFRSSTDARRWLCSRGALRRILADYLETEPSHVAFASGPAGKPQLVGSDGDAVHFNLSHSDGLALVAVSVDRGVGVDVERVRSGLDEIAIARRAFGSDAVRLIEGSEPRIRTATFFRLWVRHEAAVKCRGTGLEDVVRDDLDDLVDVNVAEVDVGEGFAAALGTATVSSPTRFLSRPTVDRWRWVPPTIDGRRWSTSPRLAAD